MATGLWKPVLLRAGVALVFGAVTVFWGSPSVHVLAWATGLYLLATAGAAFLAASIPAAAAVVVGLAGVGALMTQSDTGVGVSALVGLLVLGAFELVKGFRQRGRHVLARDWIISGVVGIGTAVALPFFISLGSPRASRCCRRRRHHLGSLVGAVRVEPAARWANPLRRGRKLVVVRSTLRRTLKARTAPAPTLEE